MSPIKLLTPLALVAALTATAALGQAPATTPIKAADGKVLGEAAFTDAPTGVLLQVKISGLTPGWHGMHFHAVGDCGDAKFLNSGAHIQHAGMKMEHGLLNPKGPDMGDLPNIYVGADGTGQAQAFTTLVSWKGAGNRPALSDADGSALVFHANPDDGKTQPIGGAGDRVACAVVK
jgi:Cu-Zn family superoxide dismutase